jgi:hypothetical protein
MSNKKDTSLIDEAISIFEAKLTQAAFKSNQDAWLGYYTFVSQQPGREQDAKQVLQRAMTFCVAKDKLMTASK